jgi:hypothetical protein
MKEYRIGIDFESISVIVRNELEEDLKYLMADLEGVHENKRGRIFSIDYEEDVKKITKMIKAFDRVIKYYSPPSLKDD